MKILACLFTMVFIASSCVSRASAQNSDEKAVTELERQLQNYKDGIDAKFADRYIDTDLIWEYPGGRGGMAEFIKPFERQKVLDQRVDDLNVRIFENTAVVSGHWSKKAVMSDDGKTIEFDGFLQDVWVKKSGQWKLVATATAPHYHQNQTTK